MPTSVEGRRRPGRLGVAALLLSAVVSGCDRPDGEGATDVRPVVDDHSWPTVVLEDGVVEHLLEWQIDPTLAGRGLSVPAEADGDHVLATSPIEGVYVGRPGEEPSLLHQHPGGDWLIDFAEVAGGFVAVAEHEERNDVARMWLYDLAAGSRSLLADRDGSAGQLGYVELSLDEDGLAWTEPSDDGGVCINVMAHGRDASEVASCSPRESGVGRVFLRWPVLSWIEYGTECSKAYRMVLGEGGPVQVDDGECAAFQVVSDLDTTVWFEFQPGSPHVTEQRLWGLDAAGEQVSLGVGAPGSATLCAGRAYWKKEAMSRDDGRRELRAWDGGGDVEVVYRSTSPDFVVTSLATCRGDRLMAVRSFTGVGDGADEIITATYR